MNKSEKKLVLDTHSLEQNLHFLDVILTNLSNSATNVLLMDNSLTSGFYYNELSQEFLSEESMNISQIEFDPKESTSEAVKLLRAINFLQIEGLVNIELNTNLVSLTFGGVVKLSQGGFLKQYLINQNREKRDKYTFNIVLVTLIAVIIQIVLMIIF